AWPAGMIVFAAVLVAGISILAVLTRRRQPWLLVGWFWFLGMLVPVIGVVQAGLQSMADRYTYLPSIGILIMIVWGVSEFAKGWAVNSANREKDRLRHLIFIPACAAVVACVMVTHRQIG